MSGHPQGGHYDDGYGQPHGTDSYYQDDQGGQAYYDHNNQHYNEQHPQGGHEGYYDESYVPREHND